MNAKASNKKTDPSEVPSCLHSTQIIQPGNGIPQRSLFSKEYFILPF